MSFTSMLIHTCDVGTLTQGTVDDYGKRTETWPVLYTDQPCRLMGTGGREVKVGAVVVISNWKLFMSNDVNIDEQDRVSDIRLASSGKVIDASTYEVILVQFRSDGASGHHKEVFLQKVA